MESPIDATVRERLRVVRVTSPAEESFVLASGSAVIPVLDEEQLWTRMLRCWDDVGIRYQVVSMAEIGAYRGLALELPCLPPLLLAMRRVLRSHRALAEAAADRRVWDLEGFCGALEEGTLACDLRERVAVVLFTFADLHPFAVRCLESLIARGFTLGLVLADAGAIGRFSILKALTMGAVIGGRGICRVASSYSRSEASGGPVSLVVGERANDALLARGYDAFILSGHSNQWDAFGGENFILCAREGRSRDADHGLALLPACYGGSCARREQMGKDPWATGGLISVGELDTRVLFLSGCAQVRLGCASEHPAFELIYQALASDILAVVGAIELIYPCMGADTVFEGMLAAGAPLWNAVESVNALHRGGSSGRGQIGPFLIFGNPCLRLLSIPHIELSAYETDAQLVVDIPGALAAVPDGLRASVSRVTDTLCPVVLTSASVQAWVQGGQGNDGRLYLWIRLDSAQDTQLAFSLGVPWAQERNAWLRAAAEFPRRAVMVAAMMEQIEPPGELEAREHQVLALTRGTVALEKACFSLRPQLGLVQSLNARQSSRAWVEQMILSTSAALIECICELSVRKGPGMLMAIGPEEMAPVPRLIGECKCGRGTLWERSFHAAHGNRRVERACDGCAALSMSDGRELCSIVGVEAGGEGILTIRLQYSAPEDEDVFIAHRAYIKSLLICDVVWGSMELFRLAAGNAIEVCTHIDLEHRQRRGGQNVGVVAVLNGRIALNQRTLPWVSITSSQVTYSSCVP